jgi:adenosylcobinamide-phosphate synthase
MFFKIGLFAYIIDRVFGEFSSKKHPVVYMGNYIKWFEEKFYKDSIYRGAILTFTLILFTYLVIKIVSIYIGYMTNIYIQTLLFSIVASITISSKMLYEAVKDIITNPQNIKYLVSRDTDNLNLSNINRSAIETYAENLSDGVVAPLIYLVLFGVEGAFIYKAINTLDSMVGYRSSRYENFGKVSAILDDIVNYIPARVTAILISILMGSQYALLNFYKYGKRHDSPNAGLPISAMALAIGVKLGGDTYYFGKLKQKANFGDGREEVKKSDIKKALSLQWRLDITIVLILYLFTYLNLFTYISLKP